MTLHAPLAQPCPDRTQLAMTSMFVPEPVMSLAITPKKSKKGGGSDTTDKFSKVEPMGPSLRNWVSKSGDLLVGGGCYSRV